MNKKCIYIICSSIIASTVCAQPVPFDKGSIFPKNSTVKERGDIISNLPEQLPPLRQLKLQDTLLTFAKSPDLPSDETYMLCNRMLDLLRRQELCVTPFSQTTLEVAQDDAIDTVIRDYAIQHLGRWYEKRNSDEVIDDFLYSQVENAEKTVGGTSLLALLRHGKASKNYNWSRFKDALEEVFDNPNASDHTALSALQCVTYLKDSHFQDQAKEILQTTSSEPLRVTALSAFSATSGSDVKPYLEDLLDQQISPIMKVQVIKELQNLR